MDSAGTPPAPPLPAIEPAPPVIAIQHPTFLAPSRPRLAGTALSLDIPHGPALPFARSTGDQPAPPPPALPRVNKTPAALSGTAMMLDLPIGPALPFARGTGDPPPAPLPALPRFNKAPRAPLRDGGRARRAGRGRAPFRRERGERGGRAPALTLEEYAALRASLTVKGEEDPETWKAFGIASRAMKEALQARVAARLRDDPEARDRVVALVQRMVSDLRAKAPGG